MAAIDDRIRALRARGVDALRLDPYLACNFVVEIEGLLAAGFVSCAGLEVETEKYEYREGGVNDYLHRFAGATHHPPLLFSQGLSPLDGLWNWHQDVVDGLIERRNGTIYLLNRKHLPVMWWNFSGALPTKWTGPTLEASKGAVAFQSVELVHKGLSRPSLGTSVEDIAAEGFMAADLLGGFF
jgi:phage tail-like protein